MVHPTAAPAPNIFAMKKSEIKFHSDGYSPAHPAVNVKCRHWIDDKLIKRQFGCNSKVAQQAAEYAWQNACEQFWGGVQETADHFLGLGHRVYSEGRSSGWLVVHSLPDVDSWDAIMVSKWSRFVHVVEANVEYYSSDEQLLGAIEVNQWAKAGAELYNFIDLEDGRHVCIADLKQQAIAAGFGPVVK